MNNDELEAQLKAALASEAEDIRKATERAQATVAAAQAKKDKETN